MKQKIVNKINKIFFYFYQLYLIISIKKRSKDKLHLPVMQKIASFFVNNDLLIFIIFLGRNAY